MQESYTMFGRKILTESDPVSEMFNHPIMIERRKVLRETLEAFSAPSALEHYHLLASQNLERWREERKESKIHNKIQVLSGDWGEVTHMLSKKYGACFAVLNMANAYVPGGGYVEGMSAQEENMFRRTDCHFHIGPKEYDSTKDRYTQGMRDLISAKYGRVYLDTEHPRVCIRGKEESSRDDLGYKWIEEDEIFPFYEMRSAAQDLRGEEEFSVDESRKRIAAQLDTLLDYDARYTVLGAFGCGAFLNPADKVAQIYKEEILKRIDGFELIAFAILSTGYGRDNFTPFYETLKI